MIDIPYPQKSLYFIKFHDPNMPGKMIPVVPRTMAGISVPLSHGDRNLLGDRGQCGDQRHWPLLGANTTGGKTLVGGL